MKKDEVQTRLCALLTKVATAQGNVVASDCLCSGRGDDPTFCVDESIIIFVEEAVNRFLETT